MNTLDRDTPNLFTWATSELSQDAFLCWLLAWADPRHAQADPALHACARSFLGALFERANERLPDDASIEVKKRVAGCDVVAKVGASHVLLLEDKVDTGEHSNQLERYRNDLREACPGREQVLIYLETGDEPATVPLAEGWNRFSRSDLLDLLDNARGVKSDIFVPFRERLRIIEDAARACNKEPAEEWDWRAWSGFFSLLQEFEASYLQHPREELVDTKTTVGLLLIQERLIENLVPDAVPAYDREGTA